MKFFSRSSRATGPKMRVPRGLRALSMMTAAFSSNAMNVPSSRAKGFLVRTTTALTTSPFLTAPLGGACFTVPTVVSPPLAPLYRAVGRGLLDRADDDVADPRVAAFGAAADADAEELAGAGVVGD